MKLASWCLALASCAASPEPPSAPRTGGAIVERPLAAWLERHRGENDPILADPAAHRVQVVLGELVPRGGRTVLVQSTYRAGAEYFYPASTVKLCGALAALERLNALRRTEGPALDEDTPLTFEPFREGAPRLERDESNLDGGTINLRHMIRKVCLVSDNEAYNRLYDFCGQDWLNQRMWRAGLPSTRLTHRLSVVLTAEENRATPAVELRPAGAVFRQGAQRGSLALENRGLAGLEVGTRRFDDEPGQERPMDFRFKNGIALVDLQRCLVRALRPDVLVEGGEPFDLTAEQRELLLDALSTYPADSPNPRYERERYPDDHVKFFLPGLLRVLPKERLRVANKVGLAYGFATDTAYVEDCVTGRSFFLAATIYANADGVVGDDRYEYDTVALPWLADVAEVVARELLAERDGSAEAGAPTGR